MKVSCPEMEDLPQGLGKMMFKSHGINMDKPEWPNGLETLSEK